jgi:hypothetical protein
MDYEQYLQVIKNVNSDIFIFINNVKGS